MTEELYFPLFVDLSKKSILVVGAGKIASRRVSSLLPFAGRIKVVAPKISREITEMEKSARKGSFLVEQRSFQPSDLDGADIVLAATDDKELNTRIGAICRERKIPVNVSHAKELCDFYFPGTVRKDNVVIGVTASGKDHGSARKVTELVRAMMENKE